MKKITVIDDDKHIAQLLQSKLTQLGYDVSLCFTARDALATLVTSPPDLAILDVMLGDGLGYEIARGIRKHPLIYQICILFHSVAGEQQDIQHAISNGGDGFLQKPYTSTQLLERLASMARLHESLTRKCPITGLANVEALRREVDHRIFRQEDVSVVYIFVDGKPRQGDEPDAAENSMFALLADIGGKVIKNQAFYETCFSHAGGGHFLLALRAEDEQRFCHAIEEAVKLERERFKALNIDLHTPPPERRSSAAEKELLTIRLRSINSVAQTFTNAHEMFRALQLSKEGTAIAEAPAPLAPK